MARLIFLGCVAYVTIGLGHLVVGTVMEPMVHAYGVPYGAGGQLVMHQFLGAMAGMIAAPWLMGRAGKKGALLCALLVLAAAQGVYASGPPWAVMLGTAPFAGFGLGVTEVSVGAFIIGAAKAGVNVAMSRVEVFFGLGALMMPFAGAVLIGMGYWKMSFGLVGALALASAALWLAYWPGTAPEIADAPIRPLPEKRRPAFGKGAIPAAYWLVLVPGCAFFAVYVGLEMSLVHYLPSILVLDGGLAESAAALSLSVYWGAMTIGRIVSGYIADKWGGGRYLLATCAACAALCAAMGVSGSAGAVFALAGLIGLAMSGMYAVALVFVNQAAPGASARTTSLLMTFGVVGGAALPKLSGWFLDGYGVAATRWLFALFSLFMIAALAWLLTAARRSGPA